MRYEEIFEDMRCPECGYSESLQINVTHVKCCLEIDAKGVHLSRYLGSRVSPNDTAKCPKCHHAARVSEFSQLAAECFREDAHRQYKADDDLHGTTEDFIEAPSEIDPSKLDWYTLEELEEDARDLVRDWWVDSNRDGKHHNVVKWTLEPGNLLYIVENGIELPNFTDEVFMPSGRFSYGHQDNACERVRGDLPGQPRLHAIADAFDEVQRPYDYALHGALEISRHAARFSTSFSAERWSPHTEAGSTQTRNDPSFRPYPQSEGEAFDEADHQAAEKIKALMMEFVEWLMERYRDLVDQQIEDQGYRFDKQARIAILADSDPATAIKII